MKLLHALGRFVAMWTRWGRWQCEAKVAMLVYVPFGTQISLSSPCIQYSEKTHLPFTRYAVVRTEI